ncbi:hypothetical protein V0U79_06490 [Hyphobacterium sp. HN65]|uniref:Nuclear transport factor 2 family protein n=1 Tax=Hyphobacterium lacteum TaxID=3116575 RepID=A0ABU7LQ15_9PROT|nr:hypothetical protein [Hyphobacterium sp. HN65]MEE2526009.1 hypothetical protein [Hyphobacterium sp. HN65]
MIHSARLFAAAILTAGFSAGAFAQDQDSLDALIDATYAVISGGVGEQRDWDQMRSQFLPDGSMTVVNPRPDGTTLARTLTVDDYIEASSEFLMQVGFVERETRRATYIYGEVATVLSAYEGYRTDTDEVFVTGVNTFVAVWTEGEWKIASINWRNGVAIPVEDAFIDRAE